MRVRLDVIVFNRDVRAAAWSELMGREMDIKDPDTGQSQARVAGPDEPYGVWLVSPIQDGGIATVAGRRGTVGFVVQVRLLSSLNEGDRIDLSARAETIARQAANEWSTWLGTQGGA